MPAKHKIGHGQKETGFISWQSETDTSFVIIAQKSLGAHNPQIAGSTPAAATKWRSGEKNHVPIAFSSHCWIVFD